MECKKNFLDGTTRRAFFEQEPPKININPFSDDKYLLSVFDRIFDNQDQNYKREIMNDLDQFAERTREGTEIFNMSREAYLQWNQPKLKKFNGWGKQIDQIWTCGEWKKLHAVASNEGLVSIAYERKHDQFSRLHQLIKLMLFSPVSGKLKTNQKKKKREKWQNIIFTLIYLFHSFHLLTLQNKLQIESIQ